MNLRSHAVQTANQIGNYLPAPGERINWDNLRSSLISSIEGAIKGAIACEVFATMPQPPDDMGSLEGLEAYAEAIAQWRADWGFPIDYDGPLGPVTDEERSNGPRRR